MIKNVFALASLGLSHRPGCSPAITPNPEQQQQGNSLRNVENVTAILDRDKRKNDTDSRADRIIEQCLNCKPNAPENEEFNDLFWAGAASGPDKLAQIFDTADAHVLNNPSQVDMLAEAMHLSMAKRRQGVFSSIIQSILLSPLPEKLRRKVNGPKNYKLAASAYKFAERIHGCRKDLDTGMLESIAAEIDPGAPSRHTVMSGLKARASWQLRRMRHMLHGNKPANG